jgi:hypothetical protein
MRIIHLILLISVPIETFSQKIIITTPDNAKVEVTIASDSVKQRIINDFNGIRDNSLRKQWTARTYRLSDNKILLEFYDKQAAIIGSLSDFEKIKEVRFIKTYIDFLKKNVTYKIEIVYKKGKEIIASLNLKPLEKYKKELHEFTSFEVYELPAGQFLFLYTIHNTQAAAIYENIKALASECGDVLNQYYGGIENSSKKFINGDPLFDYETDGHLVYPKDVTAIIQNHKLTLLETKVYVKDFYGNLYKSEKGYYILVDEINQKNGAGNKMLILTARVYESLEDVRKAQARYKKNREKEVRSEHFYQKISDRYGKDFPNYTQRLIDSLPLVLNFDQTQLTFDSTGMEIVDEAIHWIHSDYKSFNKWYPSVLAYYGQCYMSDKKDGKWIVVKEDEYNVLTPHLILANMEDAFDVYDFYKDLSEWPISIKEAGDWDGWQKEMRKGLEEANRKK